MVQIIHTECNLSMLIEARKKSEQRIEAIIDLVSFIMITATIKIFAPNNKEFNNLAPSNIFIPNRPGIEMRSGNNGGYIINGNISVLLDEILTPFPLIYSEQH